MRYWTVSEARDYLPRVRELAECIRHAAKLRKGEAGSTNGNKAPILLAQEALEEAGIDRANVYVTNAVKHFKWEARGKRRLHKRPDAVEVAACRPWLDKEIELVRPRVVVCLGATAAQALLGRTFRVTKQRGELFPQEAGHVITATVHPSSILRAPDAAARESEMAALTEDLRQVAKHLA